MIRKIVKICGAIVLIVAPVVQAADVLYVVCLDEGDRLVMRTLQSECDTYATGVEEANYSMGTLRLAIPTDDLSAFDVPDCASGGSPAEGHGYGRGYGYGYGYGYGWGGPYGYGPGYGWGYPYGDATGYDTGYTPDDNTWTASALYICVGAP